MLRFFKSIGFFSLYLVSKNQKQDQYNFFMADPNKKHLEALFNFGKNNMARNMYKLNIPNIYQKQVIFVPMITRKLKLEEAISYEKLPLEPGNMDANNFIMSSTQKV